MKIVVLILILSSPLFGQNTGLLKELSKLNFDSTTVYKIKLKDNSEFYCLADSLRGDTLYAKSLFKNPVTLTIDAIEKIFEANGEWRDGEFYLYNPFPTRMIFTPTGKTLPPGKVLISYSELIYSVITYSPFAFMDIGAGFSAIPFNPQTEHMFYTKLLLFQQSGLYASIGGVLTHSEGEKRLAPFASISLDNNIFVLNLSGGGKAFFASPVISASAEIRGTKWNSVLIELLALPDREINFLAFSSRLRHTDYAADIGFILPWENGHLDKGIFPWLTFYYYIYVNMNKISVYIFIAFTTITAQSIKPAYDSSLKKINPDSVSVYEINLSDGSDFGLIRLIEEQSGLSSFPWFGFHFKL